MNPRARQREACPQPRPSSEAARRRARRTTRAARSPLRGVSREAPVRDDPKPTAIRPWSEGVGAHCRREPLGVGGSEALPGPPDAYRASWGSRRRSAARLPRGGRPTPAEAGLAEGWGHHTGAGRAGTFGSPGVAGEGGRGAPRTSTAHPTGCCGSGRTGPRFGAEADGGVVWSDVRRRAWLEATSRGASNSGQPEVSRHVPIGRSSGSRSAPSTPRGGPQGQDEPLPGRW